MSRNPRRNDDGSTRRPPHRRPKGPPPILRVIFAIGLRTSIATSPQRLVDACAPSSMQDHLTRAPDIRASPEGTRRMPVRWSGNDAGRTRRPAHHARKTRTQWSSFSTTSSYSFASSSSSSSARSLGRTRKIQPSPNASSLMVSGLSLSSSLTSTTSPDTGE